MTADDFTEAARAEAERRWSRDQSDGRPLSAQARMNRRVGFDLGARWAAAQEPTAAEVDAAAQELASAAALIVAAGPKPWEWWTDRNQARFRNAACAALIRARAARRDEATR